MGLMDFPFHIWFGGLFEGTVQGPYISHTRKLLAATVVNRLLTGL